jgi:hypothetical protein
MEAWTASAGGFGGAKTRESADNQNCCEKRLHVLSVHLCRTAAAGQVQTE